jgi:acetyl-CoA carboxylase carboxyl transferase subunit beta
MSWFDTIENPKFKNTKKKGSSTPNGVWQKCTNCSEILQVDKVKENLSVCPSCDHHFRIGAMDRINLMVDKDSFKAFAEDLESLDPLGFKDKITYNERLNKAYAKTNRKDGTISGFAKIGGKKVSMAVMDFNFMGGSMGVVTGEKIALAMDEALNHKCPCIVVSASGGARMQEGILSLMQMAKTSASRQKLKAANVPYISILTDPTTGGCAASFSMLGDINIAEPKCLIGFAGPRVIEQSIRQTLPEGFQRAEFLKEHGFVDRIVDRRDMHKELSFFVNMFS